MAQGRDRDFRLRRVLQLRERQVEVCRDRLERSRQDLQRWQEHQRQVQERRQGAGLAPGGEGGELGGAQLQLRERGRLWFDAELRRIAGEVEARRRAVEDARTDLWEAEQRRQRLDRLRERFEERQKSEAKRQQRKRMNRWGNARNGRER